MGFSVGTGGGGRRARRFDVPHLRRIGTEGSPACPDVARMEQIHSEPDARVRLALHGGAE
jgi:hypothetical protein